MIFIQLLKESLYFAYNSLVLNKLRTFLSLLGITIGIFAIISVFTVVDSLEDSIRESIQSLGDNVVYIQKWPWTPPPGENEYPWWKYLNRPQANLLEMKELKRRSTKTSAVSFFVATQTNIQHNENSASNIVVLGVANDYDKIRSFEIEKGRYLSSFELSTGKASAVIGAELADEMFFDANPIGKNIKIKGHKFTIIGIFKREGTAIVGESIDNIAVIPINYARNIINMRSENSNPTMLAKALPNVSSEELIDDLRQHMRAIRKIKPIDEDNFAMNRSSLLSMVLDGIFTVIDIAAIIIGGFSILVGGFGIANIMFVSVKEQTRIIGIQKALGAKRYFILMQFLYEAVILSLIGGLVGLFLIFIGTILVEYFAEIEITLTALNIIRGVLISVIIGIVSGILPAYMASRLNPVEAISVA